MYNHSVNGKTGPEPMESELENTVSSSRSSFADIWQSSIPVEIRDGSYQAGLFSPIASILYKCNRQVMVPYFFMLSVIGWRPFCRESFRCRKLLKLLNIFYTFIIFLLLLFSYVASITACQARLDTTSELLIVSTTEPTTKHAVLTTPQNATTFPPTNTTNHTTTTTTPSTKPTPRHFEDATTAYHSTKHTKHEKIMTWMTWRTLAPAKPDWRMTECTHMLSGYIVPKLLHFVAFLVGFYQFRIQESETLHALIEMVFLQSKVQAKKVKRLRSFLIIGVVWLAMMLATYILFCYAFGLPSVTGFRNSGRRQWVAVCLMVVGDLVANCVTFVIILNYCAQSQLLIYFLRDIALRLEEKTAEFGHVMKDLWEVKKNLVSLNGVAARITTLIVFNLCEVAVIGLVILSTDHHNVPIAQVAYRVIISVMCVLTLMCPLIMASYLTECGTEFKQRSLQMRVFGYPGTTQFDRDSFLLFIQNMDIKATMFAIPMKKSYLWGFITLVVFIVLLLMQTSRLGGNSTYI